MGSLHDVLTIVLDSKIILSEFQLQPRKYIHFSTNSPRIVVIPCIATAMVLIEPVKFFHVDDFGIR